MEKIPCEYVVWNVLPSIRKEFTKSLVRIYNLNQKQISQLLKLTPSAVSQYLSNKRGGIDITDEDILQEIDKSARNIFKNGKAKLNYEICRICNLLKSTKQISKNNEYFTGNRQSCIVKICKNNELFYENIVWNILPAIRRELTKKLIKTHKLTQKKVADILGITEAAVSRYVSGKRGMLEISNKIFLKEIQRSTNRIVKENNKNAFTEICRICNILKSIKIIKCKN